MASEYQAGFDAGYAAHGNLTVDEVEELLKDQSALWTAGFNDGWHNRGQAAEHLYGADVLQSPLTAH